MGKNKDLIQILTLVLIGMFIPFFVSITITYGLDLTNMDDLIKIGSTFGYFLLIFGIELLIVYLYFTIANKMANKNMEKFKPK
ncbi:MAG: hypothetical protein JSW06_08200 [Thermoplasmatales archaeon]|nr:MAG: hypothetical protein JSW06_08200 [Thermoplasmatales archaeon]